MSNDFFSPIFLTFFFQDIDSLKLCVSNAGLGKEFPESNPALYEAAVKNFYAKYPSASKISKLIGGQLDREFLLSIFKDNSASQN